MTCQKIDQIKKIEKTKNRKKLKKSKIWLKKPSGRVPKALRAVVKGPAPKLKGEGIKIGRPRHSLEKTTEVASCLAGQILVLEKRRTLSMYERILKHCHFFATSVAFPKSGSCLT